MNGKTLLRIDMERGGGVDLLAVVGLYVAGVIGAGFASGQELVVFFVRYGWGGFAGIFLALAILTSTVVLVLEFCSWHGVSSYDNLFATLSPRSAMFFDWAYTLFLLIGVSVMLAGAGAMGVVSRLAMAFLVWLVLQRGVLAVLEISGLLAVAMVVVLVTISLYRLQLEPFTLPQAGSWRGLEAAVLYASYNLGFSMAVLASTHQVLKRPQERWAVAIFGNLILGVLLFLLFFSLNTLSPQQLKDPFPSQHLAGSLGPVMVQVYRLILWVAMYTTALANSLALVTRFTESAKLGWSRASLVIIAVAIGLSYAGFNTLIRVAYPLLGLAGLCMLGNLLAQRRRQPPAFPVL